MTRPLGLFEAFGIEIEYAIVDRESLDVCPVADRLIEAVAGDAVAEFERGPVAWSNELALHVLELKTNGPTSDLEGLPSRLNENLSVAEHALASLGARLMPGAMHPWMDPVRESRLWPHEYNDVYRAFDRIFGCSGHGWTNLQSLHLNLPFSGDDEFHRLHAAIRMVLPLVPALAASSPAVEGRVSGTLDQRLVAYMGNSRRIPSVAGRIIPEPVSSRAAYQTIILDAIYADLAPQDPEGVLRHDWANARGAIARFGRGSIEIRLLDSQECATADIALVSAVIDVVRWVASEIEPSRADAVSTLELANLLAATTRRGDDAPLPRGDYTRLLGLPAGTAGLAWSALLERAAHLSLHAPFASWLDHTLARGPLARRLLTAFGGDPSRARLAMVYRRLCDCLATDTLFD